MHKNCNASIKYPKVIWVILLIVEVKLKQSGKDSLSKLDL